MMPQLRMLQNFLKSFVKGKLWENKCFSDFETSPFSCRAFVWEWKTLTIQLESSCHEIGATMGLMRWMLLSIEAYGRRANGPSTFVIYELMTTCNWIFHSVQKVHQAKEERANSEPLAELRSVLKRQNGHWNNFSQNTTQNETLSGKKH